jgi:hypothetical protein
MNHNNSITPTQVNPKLVFLLRVTVRFDLFEAGEMTIDEAFDGIAPAFDAIDWLTDTGVAA